MASVVCAGACMSCSFGCAPATLIVAPLNRLLIGGKPAANIMDNKPIVNIPPFGMCNTLSNPAVAAATAAKAGVFTPSACIPATAAPWTPGSPKVLIGNLPAVTESSKLICAYGGVITITMPGQFSIQA